MSIPQNEFDKFVTITHHYELHTAKTNEELAKLNGTISEQKTTRFNSTGTLLINTRKDAHQSIDNVVISVIAPNTAKSEVAQGITDISLRITEPGGFGLIEKIYSRMKELDIKSMENLLFGIKIVFVGRDKDNKITEIASNIIPMVNYIMNSEFNANGGSYEMKFIHSGFIATQRGDVSSHQTNYGFTNKNITFKASTIQEVFVKLENGLNEVYSNEIKKEIDPGRMRTLKYKIVYDAKINGNVVGGVTGSYATGEDAHFQLNKDLSISSFIMDVLKTRTPNVMKKMTESKDKLKSKFHNNVFYPVIIPSVDYGEKIITVTFTIKIYEGGGGNRYEFDYLFSDPGSNVDVLGYDLKFSNVNAWLSEKSTNSLDKQTNIHGTNDSSQVSPRHVLSENTTQQKIDLPVERSNLNGGSGDIAYPMVKLKNADSGYSTLPAGNVADAKAASNSLMHFMTIPGGIVSISANLDIRGHKQILDNCLSATSIAHGEGLWVKINSYMLDDFRQPKKFFYGGWYYVLGVENKFMNGQFTQTLSLLGTEENPDSGIK